LERAKGFEPSTPTLARSCSTTELHPHPRGRRWCADDGQSYAKCGPRMQQPVCGSIRPVPAIWTVNLLNRPKMTQMAVNLCRTPRNRSSLRTQGPITPDLKSEKKPSAAAPKRESAPYGSLRSQGRRVEKTAQIDAPAARVAQKMPPSARPASDSNRSGRPAPRGRLKFPRHPPLKPENF
jgi:hypothetical protein